MKLLFLVLMAFSTAAAAQPRAGTSEWSLHMLAIVGSDSTFDGGASARNDGGLGIGLSAARNLNDYLAVGVEGTVTQIEYRATVTPGPGNAGAAFESRGTMETAALRAHATWHLFRGPVTPFLTASGGVILLDADLPTDAPANACWFYPWYGQVCGDQAPNSTLARLTYGAGAGVRFELPARQGFVRAYLGADWIEFSEASSPAGVVQIRADFGLRF